MAEVGAVLVHGLFNGAWAWDGVRARLEAAGVPSAAVELPMTSLEDDVAATVAELDRFGKPAVLVGHSYGGAVVTAAGEHPLVRGMAAFRRFFKTQPTTLICPGEQWTNRSLECALQLGVQLVGSYYLAIRDGNRFCWAQHICSPYLDKPDPSWFDAGQPVVGYFHDFDVCRNGVEWLSTWLDMWQRAGAKRIIDYRELAAALSRRLRVEESAGGPCVKVRNEGGPVLVRPLPVCIRAGHTNKPPELLVHDDDQTSMERSI